MTTSGCYPPPQKISELSDLLTIDEMCKFLGISPKTGYRLIKGGEIKAIKVGKTRTKTLQHAVDNWIGLWYNDNGMAGVL